MKNRIFEKITKELDLEFLEVKNNSYLHKGHLGDNGTMETHFEVIIKLNKEKSMDRLKIHRKINKTLKEEFENGLHALEIKII